MGVAVPLRQQRTSGCRPFFIVTSTQKSQSNSLHIDAKIRTYLLTLETSAEVCLSSQPEIIRMSFFIESAVQIMERHTKSAAF